MDGRIDGCLPAGLALSHHLHIRVDDHDRVIDNHSQGYDQCSQRHRVQLDAEHVEGAQRDKDGDRHRTGCHHRHAHRHDQHHHHNNRRDGYQQLVQEVFDRLVNHLLLVGDRCHLDVGGDVVLDVLQLFVDRCSHARHVLPLLDLHTEQETLDTVIGDIRRFLGILTLHGGNILQSDGVAISIGIDHGILHVVDLVQRVIHVDGRLIAFILQASGSGHKALAGQYLSDGHIADAVVRQLVRVQIDADLVLLHAVHSHLTYAGNHT